MKTPADEDLGGRSVDHYKLLALYGDQKIKLDTIQKASIETIKLDSVIEQH